MLDNISQMFYGKKKITWLEFSWHMIGLNDDMIFDGDFPNWLKIN